MPNPASNAWKYFEKISSDTAKCRECSKKISCKGGSTKGMNTHLSSIHNISDPAKRKAVDDPPDTVNPPVKKMSQPSIFKSMAQSDKETLPEIVSKLVAKDGFTVNGVTKSDFIRSSLQARGFKLPKNPSAVMNLVHQQSDILSAKDKSEIVNLLQSGVKFSITFDEYSSCRNRKYVNINLHGPADKVFNLGTERAKGSCTADKVRYLF